MRQYTTITIIENDDFGIQAVTVGKTEKRRILRKLRTLGEVREHLDNLDDAEIPFNSPWNQKNMLNYPEK